MSSDRHDRVTRLFQQVCELPSGERAAFLNDACGGDAELRAEVESLLAHDGASLLETGAGGFRAVSILERAERQRRCADCGSLLPAGANDCQRCVTRIVPDANEAVDIPGYKVLGELGEGGMGKVYLAEDRKLGRRVAVKLISESFATSDHAVQRFLREARTMATVEHPNIVRVYSFGEAAGRQFLVMEYVAGESLASRLRNLGTLPVQDSLRIVRATVDALDAAWEHGIIHRDVKPGNILLDRRNQVRVADFGLAKAMELPDDLSITLLGQVLGTPSYVSPEQARGERNLDFRADVYSLGIVLFEMLSGKPPFRGETPIAIVDQQLHTPLPSVRADRPEVPRQVEQLCEWMTRKRPDDRPDSYAELRQAVDALSGTGPAVTTSGPLPSFLAGEETGKAPLFVGRGRELARLDELLRQALAGRGQVAFVTGEAGSGKTALTEEFARRALDVADELLVARGNCDAQTGIGDPYLPFREVLALLTGDVESRRSSGAITGRHARRLWGLLPVASEILAESGPDLVGTFLKGEALISRAAAFTPSPAGWRVRLEELVRRQAATPRDVTLQQSFLFEQYTRMIQTLSQHHPLLLQIEDLHWADGGSCSLLFHLGRRIAGNRVLVVGTYRPAEIAQDREEQRHPLRPVINELRRAYGDCEIGLGEEESRDFIDALVDHQPNRLGGEFRDALYRQTRGHPLFAVELLGGMREQEMLIQDEEGRWVEGPALAWGTLPARVEGAIGERIDRLPEELRHTLSLASVQGEEFSAEVLAKLGGSGAREIVGLLSHELDKRHHLVIARGIRRIDGRRLSTYRFRHILFQKYVYGQLDEVERPYLHEEVGNALEELYGEQVDEVAVQLARHFREAGITDKAIRYLRQAGQKAARLSANEEAIALFRDALALVGDLSEGDARLREELALQLALGPPLLGTAGPGTKELYESCTRARELCDRVGDAPHLFQILFLLVHHHVNRLDLPEALDLAEQMIGVAESAEEPLPIVMAHWARGFVFNALGRSTEARDTHEHVVQIYDSRQHGALAYIYGLDPGVSALAFNSAVYWYLGYPDQGLVRIERSVALAERLAHASTLAHALLHAALFALHSGDTRALAEHTEALVRVCDDKGVALFGAWGEFLRGWVLLEQGRASSGLAKLCNSWETIKATGSRLGHAEVLYHLGVAHSRRGDTEAGLSLLDEAVTLLREGDNPRSEPELQRFRGELLLQRGVAAEEAESCFLRALESARARGAKIFELRAAASLARLWRAGGRREEARKLLGDVYGWFTEGFQTPDLKVARTLLDDLR